MAIFLGSGGHSAEMETLVLNLDLDRYKPRKYIVCRGDELSLRTISLIENQSAGRGYNEKVHFSSFQLTEENH